MSDQRLSQATRELLRAARSDGPAAASRAKIWSGVAGAVGGAAAAASSAGAAAAPGMSGLKMLLLGTLLGGSVSVGLATTVLRVQPSRGRVPAVAAAAVAPGPVVVAGAGAARGDDRGAAGAALVQAAPLAPTLGIQPAVTPSPPTVEAQATPVALAASREAAGRPPVLLAPPVAPAGPVASSPVASAPRPRATTAPRAVDMLEREASLVAAARAALARGEAAAALRAVSEARALPAPQLEPEELAVEAQALRALGRGGESDGVAATLRTRYPDSALAAPK